MHFSRPKVDIEAAAGTAQDPLPSAFESLLSTTHRPSLKDIFNAWGLFLLFSKTYTVRIAGYRSRHREHDYLVFFLEWQLRSCVTQLVSVDYFVINVLLSSLELISYSLLYGRDKIFSCQTGIQSRIRGDNVFRLWNYLSLRDEFFAHVNVVSQFRLQKSIYHDQLSRRSISNKLVS